MILLRLLLTQYSTTIYSAYKLANHDGVIERRSVQNGVIKLEASMGLPQSQNYRLIDLTIAPKSNYVLVWGHRKKGVSSCTWIFNSKLTKLIAKFAFEDPYTMPIWKTANVLCCIGAGRLGRSLIVKLSGETVASKDFVPQQKLDRKFPAHAAEANEFMLHRGYVPLTGPHSSGEYYFGSHKENALVSESGDTICASTRISYTSPFSQVRLLTRKGTQWTDKMLSEFYGYPMLILTGSILSVVSTKDDVGELSVFDINSVRLIAKFRADAADSAQIPFGR